MGAILHHRELHLRYCEMSQVQFACNWNKRGAITWILLQIEPNVL
jgi:hypothetical protein